LTSKQILCVDEMFLNICNFILTYITTVDTSKYIHTHRLRYKTTVDISKYIHTHRLRYITTVDTSKYIHTYRLCKQYQFCLWYYTCYKLRMVN